MLDTVIFKLTQSEVEGVDFLNDIPPILNPEGLSVNKSNRVETVYGYLDRLRVSISPNQIRVSGSLCKWQMGDNYQSMGQQDIKQAVERLSDTLSLPMDKATITRLDVGLSMPVKFKPECYLNHLGTLSRATRLVEPNTLYYLRHGQDERLCFYDKNREQRDHREPIPDLYRGTNVLRYEQRYLRRLPQLLGVPKITAELLFNEQFYIYLLNNWYNSYKNIRKQNDIVVNIKDMETKTKRGLNKMGILALVAQFGGEVQMIAHFTEAQKRGELTAKQAYDLKKAVKDACNVKEGFTIPSKEIIELDKKIAEAVRYYR